MNTKSYNIVITTSTISIIVSGGSGDSGSVSIGNDDSDTIQLKKYTSVIVCPEVLSSLSLQYSTNLKPKLGGSDDSDSKCNRKKKEKKEVIKKCDPMTTTDGKRDLAVFIHGKKDGIDKVVDSFKHENDSKYENLTKAGIKRTLLELTRKGDEKTGKRIKAPEGYGTPRWIIDESTQVDIGVCLEKASYTDFKIEEAFIEIKGVCNSCNSSETK